MSHSLELVGLVGLSPESAKKVESFNATLADCTAPTATPVDARQSTYADIVASRDLGRSGQVVAAQATVKAAEARAALLVVLNPELGEIAHIARRGGDMAKSNQVGESARRVSAMLSGADRVTADATDALESLISNLLKG